MISTACYVNSSWDLGSAPTEKVGQGEVGRFAEVIIMLVSGLGLEKPLVGAGCMGHFSPNLHKSPCRPSFLTVKLFSQSRRGMVGREP